MNIKFHKTVLFNFLILLLILIFNNKTDALVFNGDLTLTTQAQVDSFNYTEVTGNLVITGNNITNLNGLSELTSVGRMISIYQNSELTNFDGLSNLSYVGYILSVFSNPKLSNINGLSAVDTVLEMVSITNNPLLTNINGLSSLTLTETVQIINNTALTNIDGLSGITSVVGGMVINNNNSLANINGLSNLTSAFNLSLINNPLLTSLSPLLDLTTVLGGVAIENSDGLTSLDGLDNLATVKNMIVQDNVNLTSVAAISDLTVLELLEIRNNDALTRLELTNFTGTVILTIAGNDGITNLDDLSNVTSLETFQIENNSALTNLNGLANIDSLEFLRVTGNHNMTNLSGLHNLVYIRSLRINQTDLVNLHGLENVKSMEQISIENNSNLTSLEGLSGLTSFSWILSVSDNPVLTNINALSNIGQAGSPSSLTFLNNTSLTEFCGLFQLLNKGFPWELDQFKISGNAENPSRQEIIDNGPCSIESTKSFIAVLLGDNEVPPVETDASGGGMFILNATQDSLWFWIRVCELKCPFTAAHFHTASPDSAGPVVRDLTMDFAPDTMGSYVASGVWTSSDAQPLTPALVQQLLNGNIYVNVHSTGYPMGEIRGQLTSDVPVELFANLDGGQETPPVMTMGSGEGHFTLSGDGDSLEFSITFGNLSGPVAASHFHKAAFGVPGPVVRGFTTVGDSMAEGVWTNMDAQPLTPQLVADILGCFVYVNIHTQQHPAGEIRGQLYKTESMMKQYMTIWAAENDADANQYSKLNFYSLAEGKQFLNLEGDITGYNGEKRIADLTIDIGGNIYFLNNTWTSMIYKIKASAIDLDGSTPVYAKQIGRTRTFPDEKLVWLSHIQFIRGKLYGLDNKTNKLYEINQYNAYVKEIADLSSLDKMASGFALGADGNVYLLKTLDNKKSEIWKFDSFPGNSLSLVTGISSLDVLESFASHPNGRLYASDKNNLYEIDLSQRTVGVLKDHQVSISAMDFDTHTEKTVEAKPTVAFTDISSVTDVDGFTGIPTQYSLSQNYPNPFNPNTTIKYTLPEGSFVKLKVYNSLGELVKTLVSETKDAGYYEISFDASSLSSGMYIYKIEAGNFVSSSKMVLLK